MIPLPITLDYLTRIETPPDTPFRQCGSCQYVGRVEEFAHKCPVCESTYRDVAPATWPELDVLELWHEEVFCWNHQRAELATAVAAFYFEASLFNFLLWGTRWLDPKRNWIKAEPEEYREKEDAIWKYLETLRSPQKCDQALTDLFGTSLQGMLRNVLGPDFEGFWKNYEHCRKWRNEIAHRGRRILFASVPEEDQEDARWESEQMLRASLDFVLTCWIVFARLWNEYIHKRMFMNRQNC